jgi:hypothetical protein
MAKSPIKKLKVATFADDPFYPDWTRVSVSISPKILKEAQRFSKQHDIRMSQLVNSAIKVFISEADEYLEEQRKLKSMWPSEGQQAKSGKTKDFRISKAYATTDAIKAHELHPYAHSHFGDKPKKKK